MLRRLIPSSLAALVTVALATTAQAQATCGNTGGAGTNCTPAGVNVSVTVQRIIRLSVTPASASLTAPTDVSFASADVATITDLGLHSLSVRTNVNWALTIAGAASWTAPWAKPVADLEWTNNGGTAWNTMSTTATSIGTGSATVTGAVNIGYRTTWTLPNDVPGAYSMPVTFTLSSP